jgi:dTDP-4-amino-4,6-dideoxygalactose transaminase
MAEPDLGQRERELINCAVFENQIGTGRFIKEFEDSWADLNGYKYGVSCNSGTNALHLAVQASGGGRIAISNFSMAGTAWPALYSKENQVTYIPTRDDLPLTDCYFDPRHFDVIIFAHIFGRKAYPEGHVKKLKELNPNLIVIDDMAEAHGVNAEGDIACYSFYGNKIITTGEGGMCITNNYAFAEEMRSLANMYFDKERSMIHPKIGYNFRMTNLQAAIGVAQVERLEEILDKRARIERWYDKHLPSEMKLPQRDVLWFYDIKVKNAAKTRKYLKSQGVDSRRFFYPMSLQPWGNGMYDPNALDWYEHGLLLPVHNKLGEAEIKFICKTIKDVR